METVKSDYLLSAFIPSRNRVEYLGETLRALVALGDARLEIVVHDNSDDSSVIQRLVADLDSPHVVYFHSSGQLSQAENSDRAASIATGRYVTYLGDDDCITASFIDMVAALEDAGVEAAVFPAARYYWPDVIFKAKVYPPLSVPGASGHGRALNIGRGLKGVLRRGGNGLGDLPRVYHGVVQRDAMERVKAKAGSYFPGPSPDMANAVGLAIVTGSLVRLPIPVLVNGVGYHSAAGRGLRGEHKAALADVAQLPSNVEQEWDSRIPRVWLGPTIWAQSCAQALRRMGRGDLAERMSLARLYAYVLVFHPDCWRYVLGAGRRAPAALLAAVGWVIWTLGWRGLVFIRNRVRWSRSVGGTELRSCPSIAIAVSETDRLCAAQVSRLGGWESVVGRACGPALVQ